MDIPSFFQVIAEIGVAIAGFSGLIVALRKAPGPLTTVQKYRLRILLLLAFGAMFLSLLPELLVFCGTAPSTIWKLCSLALCVYSIVFLAWWIPASAQTKKAEPRIFNRFAYFRMAAGHGLVILLQTAFLASFVESGIAVFAIGLTWYLVHSAQQFTRMLFVHAKSDAVT